jgi:DNA-binding MarR family transcriptional regulator
MNAAKTLREAIRQTRPFESLHVEALVTLAWAFDRLSHETNRPLCDAGLSPPQYNVLRILRGTPEGLQTHQVVERLVTRAPNITRLVDKLEAKGLLRRQRSRDDRRVVHLRITPAGLELLRELDGPLERAITKALGGLDEDGLRRLIALLTQLAGTLESTTPSSQEEYSS